MKSLERRFKNIADRNPMKSSYICFAEAVKGQKFSRKTIMFWFKEMLNLVDYDKSDKRILIQNLVDLSNYSEDGIIRH